MQPEPEPIEVSCECGARKGEPCKGFSFEPYHRSRIVKAKAYRVTVAKLERERVTAVAEEKRRKTAREKKRNAPKKVPGKRGRKKKTEQSK